RRLFDAKGCLACHGGARGASKRFYGYDEIGTEDAMMRWMDADLDGTPCCGIDLGPGEFITHGIKAPRLVGLWAQKRFLHNGSVDSLEDLFCRNGPRPTIADGPFSDRGHRFTCDGLTDGEKDALVAYLEAL
ncbi:MAG: hypothetical protein KC466_21350, partial [Myxococcales bacterium]|nr:hypothetical protein [Myxococcales bacterium]